MTILYECYKDAHTVTAYYGYVIDDAKHIYYIKETNCLVVHTNNDIINLDLNLARKLEVHGDEE